MPSLPPARRPRTGCPSHNACPPTWPATHALGLGRTRTTLEPESRHETSCRILRAKVPTNNRALLPQSPLSTLTSDYQTGPTSQPIHPPYSFPLLFRSSTPPSQRRQSQPNQTNTPTLLRPPGVTLAVAGLRPSAVQPWPICPAPPPSVYQDSLLSQQHGERAAHRGPPFAQRPTDG